MLRSIISCSKRAPPFLEPLEAPCAPELCKMHIPGEQMHQPQLLALTNSHHFVDGRLRLNCQAETAARAPFADRHRAANVRAATYSNSQLGCQTPPYSFPCPAAALLALQPLSSPFKPVQQQPLLLGIAQRNLGVEWGISPQRASRSLLLFLQPASSPCAHLSSPQDSKNRLVVPL